MKPDITVLIIMMMAAQIACRLGVVNYKRARLILLYMQDIVCCFGND